ncbi:MAG: helix-turn-helix domain-containing protein [Eubacteriales bacterium]|nr:helix-turn-helix domain-containing protein [Eubacteriales bacterium]
MREKISPRIKQKVVTEIESGRLSQSEAARRLCVGKTTIRQWLSKYRSEGNAGLEKEKQNRIYSVQTKQQAVEAYLTGKYSQQRICEIFKIRSRAQLQNWLKVYNSGKDFKQMSGGSRMKSTHKATKEERIQIAKECLASGNNYGEIAKKYGVSYQQARTWTLKYKELGEAGLEDRRGQRKYEQEPRTELEQAQIEIAQLKHQLRMAEMENHLLKKLKEIERRETLGK